MMKRLKESKTLDEREIITRRRSLLLDCRCREIYHSEKDQKYTTRDQKSRS